MNLLPYELFASVARTLNISKTAEQYFMSQPAVSHHIKALEQSLGVELVNRTKRGVTLTAEGMEYLPYIQEILAINERADNRMRNLASGTMGHVSIASLSSASFQVSDCLVPLYADHADIQVDVSLLDGQELSEAMRANTHDFYFAVASMPPDNAGYRYKAIHEDRLSLFVNRNVFDKIDLNDWTTVAEQPFISVPRADVLLYRRVMSVCRNRGFAPHIINVYNRAESIMLSVNAGLGVAILPDSLGKLYQRPNVIALPISGDDAKTETIFVWSPDRLTSTGKLFKDIVFSSFGLKDD